MMRDFAPYEQALELKELGFDEPCFGYFYTEDKFFETKIKNSELDGECSISAPLYQQAFRWFREKYNLGSSINFDPYSGRKSASWHISGGIWDLNGYKDSKYDWDSEEYRSYEEAELECLKKLIEIVKENKES